LLSAHSQGVQLQKIVDTSNRRRMEGPGVFCASINVVGATKAGTPSTANGVFVPVRIEGSLSGFS
jgi:hypothetical protein